MLEIMLNIKAAAIFVAAEFCLEIRQVVLEVFSGTLNAIVTAIYK